MILPNKRLLACADMIQGDSVCDVGTDHAQLPVYLLQQNRIKKAIACDIGKGPLQAAWKTIRKAGLSDQISLVLSDGLQNITETDLTDIVIAGMGGETMIHILETCPFSLEHIHLILQPMTKAELLRKWIFEHGYAIQKEVCVKDGKFLYAVMQVQYTGICRKPDWAEMYFGKMAYLSDIDSYAYARRQLVRIYKNMRRRQCAGKDVTQLSEITNYLSDAVYSRQTESSVQVGHIYDFIDSLAPFRTQEKWDNSGLLVGSVRKPVKGILVTLDISLYAVEEAAKQGCNVIISHHPVIFSGLKTLDWHSVPYQLARHDINAICNHTPMDMAVLNDLLAEKLCTELDIQQVSPLLELGKILKLSHAFTIQEIAAKSKKALGCTCVRCSRNFHDCDTFQSIGICTGSGASLLEDVAGSCDCLLTGDIKHDRWYKAQELGMGLIDCGHYHTEILMVEYLVQKLREAFPNLHSIAFTEGDPVHYL